MFERRYTYVTNGGEIIPSLCGQLEDNTYFDVSFPDDGELAGGSSLAPDSPWVAVVQWLIAHPEVAVIHEAEIERIQAAMAYEPFSGFEMDEFTA